MVATLVAAWTLPLGLGRAVDGFRRRRRVVIPAALPVLDRVAAASPRHLQAKPPDERRRRRGRRLRPRLLGFAFVAHQAWLMVDAIVRTLARVYVTRRNLLEWPPPRRPKPKRGTRPRRVLPADGEQRGDRRGRGWSCVGRRAGRRVAGGAVRRGVVVRPLIARAVSLPAARVGRRAALGRGCRDTSPHRPANLAVLRDVRRSGGPRAAARQLPGGSEADRGASNVADEHRDVSARHRDGSRLRLDRHDRHGRTSRGDPGDHREARTLPRTPLQLVRHARPAPARARVRVVGRQRQPRRPPADRCPTPAVR